MLRNHDLFERFRFRFWLVGSLTRADQPIVLQAVPFIAAGAVLALALAGPLDAAALGDDAARGIGARPVLLRGLAIGAIVVLAGTATAVAGPIGFVALVAPQIVRRVLGAPPAGLLPASGVGALVVAAADLARPAPVQPGQLPAGVLTAAVGAPVLLYLQVRVSRRSG